MKARTDFVSELNKKNKLRFELNVRNIKMSGPKGLLFSPINRASECCFLILRILGSLNRQMARKLFFYILFCCCFDLPFCVAYVVYSLCKELNGKKFKLFFIFFLQENITLITKLQKSILGSFITFSASSHFNFLKLSTPASFYSQFTVFFVFVAKFCGEITAKLHYKENTLTAF